MGNEYILLIHLIIVWRPRDRVRAISASLIVSTFCFSGVEEETRLLQNPPCESWQSLLTSFLRALEVSEEHHVGSQKPKRPSPFQAAPMGMNMSAALTEAAEFHLDEQRPRLNVHSQQGETWNRKTCSNISYLWLAHTNRQGTRKHFDRSVNQMKSQLNSTRFRFFFFSQLKWTILPDRARFCSNYLGPGDLIHTWDDLQQLIDKSETRRLRCWREQTISKSHDREKDFVKKSRDTEALRLCVQACDCLIN